MDVSVIIVNYNTRDLVLKCLKSLYATTRHLQFEVILVDNASSDGSAEAVREEFGGIMVEDGKDPATPTAKKDGKPESQVTARTIEISKALIEQKTVVFRGTDAGLKRKRISRQWQDIYSGIRTKESLIVGNRDDWKELWGRHSRGEKDTATPHEDFDRDMVIAVFMGEQKTSGYGIRIAQVEESKSKIYIDLEETSPAPGDWGTSPPTRRSATWSRRSARACSR